MAFRNKTDFRITSRAAEKEIMESSEAIQRKFLLGWADGMEDATRLNSLKSSFIASGLNFDFCQLSVETKGTSRNTRRNVFNGSTECLFKLMMEHSVYLLKSE